MTYVTQDSLGAVRASSAGRQARAMPAAAWKSANKIVTPLPPAANALIDGLPLTSRQKSQLKSTPLSFLTVMAHSGQDKVIEFLQRLQKATGKKSTTFKIGTTSIDVSPRKSDNPSLLAAKMITLANLYPVQAGKIASQMGMEIGSKTLSAVGAGVESLSRTVTSGTKKTVRQTQKQINQGVKTTQKAAETAAKTASKTVGNIVKSLPPPPPPSSFRLPSLWGYEPSNYVGLGITGVEDAAVVVVATEAAPAVAPAVVAGGGAATSTTGATFATIISAVVALAPVIVPALVNLANGAMPGKPTASEQTASQNAAIEKAPKTLNEISPEVLDESGSEDGIFGSVPGGNLILPVAIIAGAGIVAAVVLKKKK